MPKMTHPDSKQTIEVEPDHVDMYVSQGWEPKKAPAKKTAAKKTATAPKRTQGDDIT